MADDDKQGPPDGYGLGLARKSDGMGFLSGELRGNVTLQVAASLGLTETITIAASHWTKKRTAPLTLSEVITIAASHTTTYTFNQDFLGPFGSPTVGAVVTFTARYVASPTGQTNGNVRVHVFGNYVAETGTTAVVTNIRWDPRDLGGTGWTLVADWTPGGALGEWFSIISKTPLVTSATIAPILCTLQTSGGAPGHSFTIENQWSAVSQTDQATSPLNQIVTTMV